ncbi:hypothetical protein Q4511_05955 [Paracoccus sp. 1_MG-2023]|uniref:hypothetical protein n=1 Tax=unclassified Paracoccus (in: a-proteobacteria) TaxID=2688777 RepID=UPI001C09595E|nr:MULTISPECIES: hypothetical protein [unclassified Paracoccus (in: a-proteobacteria)]MBU2958334.1 hypothetical protein [Paracoccus sp. C2R09]MDO6668461.1 hypothetical protein [Paracoccus sp. 1_MG-2023]
MNIRTLATSAALVTLMGLSPVMSGMASAQEATDLPEALQSLNLSDTSVEDARRGQRVTGALEDGTTIEAMLNEDGELMGLRAEKDAFLTDEAIESLLPQAVRDNPILDQFEQIAGIRMMREGVAIGGQDADGDHVRAAFDETGRVMRFGRGDDEGRPDMRRGGDRGEMHGHDRKGPEGRDGRGHGDRDHGGRPHGDHMRGDHMKDGKGPRGDRAPQIDADALTGDLEAAGYQDLGSVRANGERLTVDATNPDGDEVTLEVTPQGEVVREIAR